MRVFLQRVRTFTDHPVTKLVLGLILMISSIMEGYETFYDDMRHFRFRAHHGLLLFALANVVAVLPDLIEGFERAFEGYETRAELKDRAKEGNAEREPS